MVCWLSNPSEFLKDSQMVKEQEKLFDVTGQKSCDSDENPDNEIYRIN
jgi:hypothetical protein